MTEQFKNLAKSTLASGITNTAGSLSVASGHGSKFPPIGEFRILVEGEIIIVRSRSGDVLSWNTGDRAAESAEGGGPAAAHSSGVVVEHVFTALSILRTAERSTMYDQKGDFLVALAPDIAGRQPVGEDGQVLMSQADQPTGMLWVDPPESAVISNHDALLGITTDNHHTEEHALDGVEHLGMMTIQQQGEQFTRMTADQVFTSNITLANLTGLSLDVEASETYKFWVELYATADPAGDLSIALTGPASPTDIVYQMVGINMTGTIFPVNVQQQTAVATAYGTKLDAGGVSGLGLYVVSGILVNGTTAGILRVQGSQRLSSAVPTTFRKSSHIYGKKVS